MDEVVAMYIAYIADMLFWGLLGLGVLGVAAILVLWAYLGSIDKALKEIAANDRKRNP